MSSTTCREDQQRALLAELADVEALEAQVFARKMDLRARMDELWNPSDGDGAQEQFGVLELAGTARIGQTRASSQLVNGTRLRDALPGSFGRPEGGPDVPRDRRAAARAHPQLHGRGDA